MLRYLAPRPRVTRFATAALAGGLVLTGCSSGEEPPVATVNQAAAPSTIEGCKPGVETADGYCAVVQFATDTFKNYEDASGISDTRLAIGTQVMVLCRIPEQTIDSGQGGWYQLAESGEFAPANNFENGDEVGQPVNRAYDPDIRKCTKEEVPS